MKQYNGNIVLIGMPGAGKSTIGALLAKRLWQRFLDTDQLIQKAQGRSLQSIVDNEGYLELRRIEEKALLGLAVKSHVIATGGSAVYSPAAMSHLKASSIVVFLDVQLETVLGRLNDFGTRGLAKRPDQSLAELFTERFPLYQRYADLTVACSGLGKEEICRAILRALPGEGEEVGGPLRRL